MIIVSAAGGSGGATVSQQFDALGRRVARTVGSSTTVFVPSGQQTIADYSAGAAPASSTYRYLYASYVDEPVMRWQTAQSQAVYYHRNQQYSVVALTDASGAIVERYAYTAYGQPTFLTGSGTLLPDTAVANRYTYTGRDWDGQVQLYHYRARMYDAGLGRFCSRDPIGFEDGPNMYRYTANMPLIGIDPLGLQILVPRIGPFIPKPGPVLPKTIPRNQLPPQYPTPAPRPRGPIGPNPCPNPPGGVKKTCAKDYIGWALCANYDYRSKTEALQAEFPYGATLRSGAGNARQCGQGGGDHYNLRFGNVGFMGSIICCNCCEDTPTGAVTKKRCNAQ